MSNISTVIGWKFNHQAGMNCKEVSGTMIIVAFPGGIPSQADQDLWTSEYDVWVADGGLTDIEEANLSFDGAMETIAKALHNINNRVRVLEGKSEWTFKQTIKALRQL